APHLLEKSEMLLKEWTMNKNLHTLKKACEHLEEKGLLQIDNFKLLTQDEACYVCAAELTFVFVTLHMCDKFHPDNINLICSFPRYAGNIEWLILLKPSKQVAIESQLNYLLSDQEYHQL